jgi:hypothetical protein
MSNSITAPIIVHAAINGGGFLGGWLSARWAAQDAETPLPDGADDFTSSSSPPEDPNR